VGSLGLDWRVDVLKMRFEVFMGGWKSSSRFSGLWHFCHLVYFFFSHGVRLSLLGTAATVSPIVPAPDDRWCGAICVTRIGKENRSTQRKPAPVPLCPPQIPNDLTWARTRAAVLGSPRLTDWAMALPWYMVTDVFEIWFLRLEHKIGSCPEDSGNRFSDTLVSTYQTTRCYNRLDKNLNLNKKLWEEQIAYFPLIRHGSTAVPSGSIVPVLRN
jgi:hypothetical protein